MPIIRAIISVTLRLVPLLLATSPSPDMDTTWPKLRSCHFSSILHGNSQLKRVEFCLMMARLSERTNINTFLFYVLAQFCISIILMNTIYKEISACLYKEISACLMYGMDKSRRDTATPKNRYCMDKT